MTQTNTFECPLGLQYIGATIESVLRKESLSRLRRTLVPVKDNVLLEILHRVEGEIHGGRLYSGHGIPEIIARIAVVNGTPTCNKIRVSKNEEEEDLNVQGALAHIAVAAIKNKLPLGPLLYYPGYSKKTLQNAVAGNEQYETAWDMIDDGFSLLEDARNKLTEAMEMIKLGETMLVDYDAKPRTYKATVSEAIAKDLPSCKLEPGDVCTVDGIPNVYVRDGNIILPRPRPLVTASDVSMALDLLLREMLDELRSGAQGLPSSNGKTWAGPTLGPHPFDHNSHYAYTAGPANANEAVSMSEYGEWFLDTIGKSGKFPGIDAAMSDLLGKLTAFEASAAAASTENAPAAVPAWGPAATAASTKDSTAPAAVPGWGPAATAASTEDSVEPAAVPQAPAIASAVAHSASADAPTVPLQSGVRTGIPTCTGFDLFTVLDFNKLKFVTYPVPNATSQLQTTPTKWFFAGDSDYEELDVPQNKKPMLACAYASASINQTVGRISAPNGSYGIFTYCGFLWEVNMMYKAVARRIIGQ